MLPLFRKLLCILLFFPLLSNWGIAQNRIQKAEELLSATKGEERIALLGELTKLYWKTNPDKSIEYAKEIVILNSNNMEAKAESLYYLGNLYRKINNYRLALDCHTQALKIRKTNAEPIALSASYNNIGEIYKILSKFDKALLNFNSALEIRRKEGNEKDIAYTLNNIGSLYWLKKDYSNALEFYLKSLEIRLKLGDKTDIASSLNNLGNVYKNLNKYNKALDYYNKALEIRKDIGDKSLIAYTLNDIGGIYWRLNNYNESLRFYNQSLEIRKKLGNRRNIASTLKNIGTVYKDLNELDFSLKHYNESLKIYNEIADIKEQANVFSLIGNLYQAYNNFDKSLEYHKIALNLHQKLGNIKGIAYSSNSIGKILMDYYKSEEAEKFLLEAFKNANLSNDRNLQKGTAENLFEYYSNLGDYKKALQYYRNYSNTQYDSIMDQLSKNKISEFESKYEISKKKDEIKSLKEFSRMQAILIYLFITLILSAGIIGYFVKKNIRIRKEATAALKAKNEELKDINSRLQEIDLVLRDSNLTMDKIFNIISNDLREPFDDLQRISTHLVDSFKEPEIAKQIKLAQEIRELSSHVNDLVENVLLWSASQAGKTKYIPNTFNIKDVLNQSIQILSGPIIEKNIKIIFNMDSKSVAYADIAAISEVFKNLLSNAIKFSYPEGKITISTIEKKYWIELEISDEGIGMSKTNLNKIFRLDGNYLALGTAKEKGAGVGLLLCKEYIIKNGGKIWAESEESKGSSFYITIPKSSKMMKSVPKVSI